MTILDNEIQKAEMAISGGYSDGLPMFIARQGFKNHSLLGDKCLTKVYNSKSEQGMKVKNALGADVNITTFTEVLQGVVEQKNYDINIADFLAIRSGQGAWMEELLKWRSFNLTDRDISKGDLRRGSGKIAEADAAVDTIKIPLQKWAIQSEYTLFEIKQASQTRVWDYVEQSEKSKRVNWDLSFQKFAFLGHPLLSTMKGLLNQANVTVNTSIITKFIKEMTAAELQAFVGVLISTYFTNSNSTMKPNTFVIPTEDYLGLANAPSADFPIGKSRLEYLNDAFKMVCGPDFKILDSAFCSAANNNLSKTRYALYHRNEDNIFMPLPIPYTTVLQGTADNFNFKSISYAQYAPVTALRPASMIYFEF